MGDNPSASEWASFPDLDVVLAHLAERGRRALAANFVGACPGQLIALGGVDVHSDADFQVVRQRTLSGPEQADDPFGSGCR